MAKRASGGPAPRPPYRDLLPQGSFLPRIVPEATQEEHWRYLDMLRSALIGAVQAIATTDRASEWAKRSAEERLTAIDDALKEYEQKRRDVWVHLGWEEPDGPHGAHVDRRVSAVHTHDPSAELQNRRWEDLTDPDRARLLGQLAHSLERDIRAKNPQRVQKEQALRLAANLRTLAESLGKSAGSPPAAHVPREEQVRRLREIGRWANGEANCPWWSQEQQGRYREVGQEARHVADRLDPERGR